MDPLAPDYPELSPYCYAANNPMLYIDKDGAGPALPPLYDPSGVFHMIRSDHAELFDAFGRAQNASLSHVQKAAWFNVSHTSRTNWNTVYGVAGEVAALETLQQEDITHPIFRHTHAKSRAQAVAHGQVNIHYAHAPDQRTDIIQRVTGASVKHPYVFAFDKIGTSLFGSPTIGNVSRKENFTGFTQFVFEVKTVSAKNEDLSSILLKGIDDQLLANPRVTDGGGLPVLIADRNAVNTAIQGDRGAEVLSAIQRLEDAGGGLYTIPGLNSRASKSLNAFITSIRDKTDAVPSDYYDK